jgi:hypothetical protein
VVTVRPCRCAGGSGQILSRLHRLPCSPILRALVPRMLILDGSFLDLTDLDQCRDRIFEVAAIPRCQRAPQLGTRDPVTSVVLAVVHQDRALGFRLTASHEPSCLAAFSS